MVDGVEVSVTTSKIVTDNDTKNEEMRFLRYLLLFMYIYPGHQFYANTFTRNPAVQPACFHVWIKTRERHNCLSHLFPHVFRRQELRELRLLQKEEQRAQQQLSNKLQQQKEQIYRRFEQETTVSQKCWGWD